MTIAALIVAIVATLGGVTAVSQTAKPGDTLFPVKTTVETIQETLTLSDQQRAELQSQHALARLQEVKDQVANGNAKGLPIAISNLEEKSKAAVDSAKKANNKELAQKIENDLTQAEHEIDDLTKSSVTNQTDDDLLKDAKDTLDIESNRILSITEPGQAKGHLESALKQAQLEASESAKKVEEVKNEVAKSSGKPSTSSDDLNAVETHNNVVNQTITQTQTELKETTSGSGSTSTTTSGPSSTPTTTSGPSPTSTTTSGSGSTSGSGETEKSGGSGSSGSGGSGSGH